MSIEEAIRQLEKHIEYWKKKDPLISVEPLEMAIEALKDKEK